MAAPLPDVARRLAVPAAGLVIIALCIGAGVFIGSRLGTPGDGSAEAGFARDMATHHAQAVDMSFVVRDKSSDRELRTLASDIIVTQSTQRGIFMGWLQQWRLPQASTQPRMAWMPGHAHMAPADGAVSMHGMASPAELQRLAEANGVDAEILFLQLMIRHHEGGIIMARAVLPLSSRPEIQQLAKSIEDGQRVEIIEMKKLLAARGAQPFPSILE
jgi:uncharacterized protein (DUF305 family)